MLQDASCPATYHLNVLAQIREEDKNQEALNLNLNNWAGKAFRAELVQIPCFEYSEVSDLVFSNSWQVGIEHSSTCG